MNTSDFLKLLKEYKYQTRSNIGVSRELYYKRIKRGDLLEGQEQYIVGIRFKIVTYRIGMQNIKTLLATHKEELNRPVFDTLWDKYKYSG